MKFLRHAESEFNIGISTEDSPLTLKGIDQASKLSGTYDLVICSPLRRCIQTLEYSNIKYSSMIVCHECREYISDKSDLLPGEPIIMESELNLINRVTKFKNYLQSLSEKNILVITHADFIWYLTSNIVQSERFGRWVLNAEIVDLPLISPY